MRTLSRLVLVLLVSLSLAIPVAWAQRTPGATAGTAPSGTPSRSNQPGGPGQPGINQPGINQPGQQYPMGQRPIFLSGKVMLEGGLPPPEPVTIERVCNGRARPEAYTDSKGHFSFQLGQQTGTFMDASVGSVSSGPPGMQRNSGIGGDDMGFQVSGTGTVNLNNCELRASLPGYIGESIDLGRRSIFDNPEVGTLILHRLANAKATAISMTTLEAPKDAKKSWEKAQKLMQQKSPKMDEADKELEKAVEVYPKFAAAWYMLGENRLALKDEDGARKAFENSLAADSQYVKPYMQLALLDVKAGQWDSAADITNRLVQLNPYFSQAYFFNAVANFNRGKMDLAEKSARAVLKDDGQNHFPQAHHLLGSILAQKGDFPSAAGEFRSFLQLAPAAPNADAIRKQLTEWQDLGVIPKADAASKTDEAPKVVENK